MRAKRYLTYAACVGLSAGMFAAMPAMAQGGQPAYAAQQSATQSMHVSDAQLQKYVQAQAKVRRISQKWQAKLQNAKSKKAALQYRRKANQEMIKAIKATGLSLAEFNRITKAARTNKELAKRIQSAR